MLSAQILGFCQKHFQQVTSSPLSASDPWKSNCSIDLCNKFVPSAFRKVELRAGM